MSKQEIVTAALVLPDGKLVMQRRRPGTDLLPEFLGFWGGKVEGGETSKEALLRELGEETSLDATSLELEHIGTYPLKPPITARDSCNFILYRLSIVDSSFEVKEGASAEVYALAELRSRTDILPTVRFVLSNVVEFSDGIWTNGS